MGGNAIKTVPTKRISKDAYEQMKANIIATLTPLNIRVAVPNETPGKESFGDLDILVDKTFGVGQRKDHLMEFIKETFPTPEVVDHNPVISFAYQHLEDYHQVDFILVEHLEMAQLYFSYGDCGAIVGKYAYHHGLTYSESGLSVKVKVSYLPSQVTVQEQNENVLNVLVLTTNPTEVCEFLGLNYERWKQGFTAIEDVFEWIIQSRFFQKEFYTFLKMEHRKRAQLRPFYQQFLEFLGIDREETSNLDNKFFSPHLLESVMEAIQYFNKLAEFALIETKYLKNEERKRKFNSSIFLNHGVDKFHLYETIKSFKKEKTEDHFDEWIDSHTEEEVILEVRSWIQANQEVVK